MDSFQTILSTLLPQASAPSPTNAAPYDFPNAATGLPSIELDVQQGKALRVIDYLPMRPSDSDDPDMQLEQGRLVQRSGTRRKLEEVTRRYMANSFRRSYKTVRSHSDLRFRLI